MPVSDLETAPGSYLPCTAWKFTRYVVIPAYVHAKFGTDVLGSLPWRPATEALLIHQSMIRSPGCLCFSSGEADDVATPNMFQLFSAGERVAKLSVLISEDCDAAPEMG
jgi:hypothetical protein